MVSVDREVELERWREAGKEVGRKLGVVQERERIIKLLDNYCDNNHYLECECASQLVIIKGENK